jgi:DNA-binding NarL/FixJ family response regulator
MPHSRPTSKGDVAPSYRDPEAEASTSQPRVIRILIADDHAVVRPGLKSILEAHEGWTVVAEASNGKEAVSGAIETKPDIAILDYAMPVMTGLDATLQIRHRLPETEVLILTIHHSDALVTELLTAGARGFLLKTDATRYLISAVESLSTHQPFFNGMLSERLLDDFLAGLAIRVRSLGLDVPHTI